MPQGEFKICSWVGDRQREVFLEPALYTAIRQAVASCGGPTFNPGDHLDGRRGREAAVALRAALASAPKATDEVVNRGHALQYGRNQFCVGPRAEVPDLVRAAENRQLVEDFISLLEQGDGLVDRYELARSERANHPAPRRETVPPPVQKVPKPNTKSPGRPKRRGIIRRG